MKVFGIALDRRKTFYVSKNKSLKYYIISRGLTEILKMPKRSWSLRLKRMTNPFSKKFSKTFQILKIIFVKWKFSVCSLKLKTLVQL